MNAPRKLNIAYISDPRLSRERAYIALRAIHAMRHVASVQIIRGDLLEEEILQALSKQNFQLVLAPWYRYQIWSRIEALYGLTRTSGPTVAGYFADQVLPYELEKPEYQRFILLDLARLQTPESATLVKALMNDTTRSGLRPLLGSPTPLYTENWVSGAGLGFRIDTLLGLPEIANSPVWSTRTNALRICLSALWSLIFDEGPGKVETLTGNSALKTAKAYFQVGANAECLGMRLCYALPGLKSKDAIAKFWPAKNSPTAPAQLLRHYADLLRVHVDPDTSEVEIVISFYPSAPAEKESTEMHTFWIEPLAGAVVSEKPFLLPSAEQPLLKPFVTHNELILGAVEKVNELKTQIQERDDTIRELRAGGVGMSRTPERATPPPDAESLLEAFQERFFDARFKLRQFQHELNRMTREGAKPAEIFKLKKEMNQLTTRQKAWISKIADTLERYRQEKLEAKTATPGAGQAPVRAGVRVQPESGDADELEMECKPSPKSGSNSGSDSGSGSGTGSGRF
ncbi:MAG: hypothetical protein H7222_03460 [Methylotenera sp.]|nr:hypothetical protein [Oligoflexia bacterium]